VRLDVIDHAAHKSFSPILAHPLSSVEIFASALFASVFLGVLELFHRSLQLLSIYSCHLGCRRHSYMPFGCQQLVFLR
jgi:hypothetical protein